jgi:hypothetical protein
LSSTFLMDIFAPTWPLVPWLSPGSHPGGPKVGNSPIVVWGGEGVPELRTGEGGVGYVRRERRMRLGFGLRYLRGRACRHFASVIL